MASPHRQLPSGWGQKTDATKLALLDRTATPTASAGRRVLLNAGSRGKAWPPSRPLPGWPGWEASTPSWGVGWRGACVPRMRAWKRTMELELSTVPRFPQGGPPQRENRNQEKALQTGPKLLLARRTRSWCLRVYIRHSPALAFVCWSNPLHRKTRSPSPCALTTNTGQLESGGPHRRRQAPQPSDI